MKTCLCNACKLCEPLPKNCILKDYANTKKQNIRLKQQNKQLQQQNKQLQQLIALSDTK